MQTLTTSQNNGSISSTSKSPMILHEKRGHVPNRKHHDRGPPFSGRSMAAIWWQTLASFLVRAWMLNSRLEPATVFPGGFCEKPLVFSHKTITLVIYDTNLAAHWKIDTASEEEYVSCSLENLQVAAIQKQVYYITCACEKSSSLWPVAYVM